jgi:hypothetical protein
MQLQAVTVEDEWFVQYVTHTTWAKVTVAESCYPWMLVFFDLNFSELLLSCIRRKSARALFCPTLHKLVVCDTIGNASSFPFRSVRFGSVRFVSFRFGVVSAGLNSKRLMGHHHNEALSSPCALRSGTRKQSQVRRLNWSSELSDTGASVTVTPGPAAGTGGDLSNVFTPRHLSFRTGTRRVVTLTCHSVAAFPLLLTTTSTNEGSLIRLKEVLIRIVTSNRLSNS